MQHLIRGFLFLAAAMAFPFSARAMEPERIPCELEQPCFLGDRGYHVLAPDDWDGETALPVLLHFHGWMRDGALVVRHQRIASATRKRGVLLVAPNGVGKTWNFWQAASKDVPFAAAVLEDVAQTYPIDRDRIYISGYSYGGAMAWRFACQNGDSVTALLAVAGSIRQDTRCLQAPDEVRHVHGLTDTVMDFPMGPGGDTTYPVALWRDYYECAERAVYGPWQARSFLTFDRSLWDCAKGHVTLDIHPGGHFIPHGWIARQLDELLGLPPSYP
ncbi:MAG: prolyl oligopeptidase family serine peptidase [Roseobacter sp.]